MQTTNQHLHCSHLLSLVLSTYLECINKWSWRQSRSPHMEEKVPDQSGATFSQRRLTSPWKLQPAIRQAEPISPKDLSVKGLVEDKAVLSASSAAHFTSWSNSSQKKKKQLIQRNYPPAALSAKRFRASLSQSLARKTPFYPSSLHHTSSSRMKRVAVGQFLPFRAQFQPY